MNEVAPRRRGQSARDTYGAKGPQPLIHAVLYLGGRTLPSRQVGPQFGHFVRDVSDLAMAQDGRDRVLVTRKTAAYKPVWINITDKISKAREMFATGLCLVVLLNDLVEFGHRHWTKVD